MNKAILEHLRAHPGFWQVMQPTGVFRIEVCRDGRIYQLNRRLERDGELLDDGWRDVPTAIAPLPPNA